MIFLFDFLNIFPGDFFFFFFFKYLFLIYIASMSPFSQSDLSEQKAVTTETLEGSLSELPNSIRIQMFPSVLGWVMWNWQTYSLQVCSNRSAAIPNSFYFCCRWILVGFFVCLFCFVWCCFVVDKINVRSCVSPTATTRQTPVSVCFFLQGDISSL